MIYVPIDMFLMMQHVLDNKILSFGERIKLLYLNYVLFPHLFSLCRKGIVIEHRYQQKALREREKNRVSEELPPNCGRRARQGAAKRLSSWKQISHSRMVQAVVMQQVSGGN